MFLDIIPDISDASGTTAAWVSGGLVAAGIMISLWAPFVARKFQKPRLRIAFENSPPFVRPTTLSDGHSAFWIRVEVYNDGHSGADGCIGRLTRVTADHEQSDIDPMQLRWCGVPDARGFQPLHIAPGQKEYLNVIEIVENAQELRFVTFDGYAPGHALFVPAGDTRYTFRITLAAENADPATFDLKLLYHGDFDELPGALEVLENR